MKTWNRWFVFSGISFLVMHMSVVYTYKYILLVQLMVSSVRPAVVSPFLGHNRTQCAAMPCTLGHVHRKICLYIWPNIYISDGICDTKYHPLSTQSALSIACFTLSVRTCPYFPYCEKNGILNYLSRLLNCQTCSSSCHGNHHNNQLGWWFISSLLPVKCLNASACNYPLEK